MAARKTAAVKADEETAEALETVVENAFADGEAPPKPKRVRPGRKPSLVAPAALAWEKAKAKHTHAVAKRAKVDVSELDKAVEAAEAELEAAANALQDALKAVEDS